ncbi:glycosyltransferase family 2 protein [Dysgonomonas sp. ZJ279]|uniref:glycosyltransferase family 2 protein n=1 Tax=Dysgonomonas sp. ZJ279 TaxID=2709796 RepID=UPI0013ED3E64|nr:glycosyltransferase family 2 protein [Dysgonomonas sp. ZJ279]
MEGFSIIMPTYNQASYIRRAIKSLFNQTYSDWELIIINDGSTDTTRDFILEYLQTDRISYIENSENKGLGYALNQGLDIAKYKYIAYLPSDDFYFENHLKVLYQELKKSDDIVLVYAKTQSEVKDSIFNTVNETTNGLFNFQSLQLVQTAHKKTDDRWITRDEWVSGNLFDLFWHKLISNGIFKYINDETSNWTIHPYQHHKLVDENNGGGLNLYRQYYNVQEPIKMKVSKYKFIDEEKAYKKYRPINVVREEKNPLKILIVGELSYNPERIYALEELGHTLYGLWVTPPHFSFSTVGHLPFGNVIDIPYDNWEKTIKEIKPDIIYATLNFGAVKIAHEVLRKNLGIPFVWHFKEGPFLCRQYGMWDQLTELYYQADGKIYINPEIKQWYEQFIPQTGLSYILDGDLPQQDSFTNDFSPRISTFDGEIHTVVPGRIIGIETEDIENLAQNNIHLHVYIENYYEKREAYNKEALKIAPDHFHLHPHCASDKWVEEFSKYDAGWLHCFDSQNNGILMNAGWNDLNMPARMNTLAAAGLPMIQKNNQNHIVAMQSHIKNHKLGLFFDTYEELANQLKDEKLMTTLRTNVYNHRLKFSFDYHVPDLIDFFRKVIESKKHIKN